MSTDNLPAVQNNAVERVTAALADSDWDGVEDGHIGATVTPRLPRLRFNAKSTDEGGFYDELTGEQFKTTDFVWLADTLTRSFWPHKYGKGDKQPTCRSRNGIVPDEDSPDLQSEKCGTCPMGQWPNEHPEAVKEWPAVFEGDTTPPCKASIEVMVYLLDQQRLSLVRFGGLSTKHVHRYLGALESHVPRRPPMAYVTHCELVNEETANGVFLVGRFSVAAELPRVDATPLIELRKEKVAEWQSQLAEEVAAGLGVDGGEAGAGPDAEDAAAKVTAAFEVEGEEPF